MHPRARAAHQSIEPAAADFQYSLLEHLPQATVFVGPDGALLFANRAARTWFLSPSSGSAPSVNDFERGALDCAARAARLTDWNHGEPIQCLCSDGVQRAFVVDSGPVHDQGGALLGGLASFGSPRDEAGGESLEAPHTALLAHELRAPLAALKGWGEFAAMKLGRRQDDEALKYVLHINAQIRRLEHLTNDMLDMARVEHGQLTLDIHDFDLREAAVLVLAELALNERVRIHRTGPLMVHADMQRLEQVLVNLVSNAIKYSPQGGDVDVTLWSRGPVAVVAVADRGVGIPAHELPHIFDRYFRASSARGYSGLGLGLYVSRLIIEAHGGTMRARGRRGGGTMLSFTLPVAATTA